MTIQTMYIKFIYIMKVLTACFRITHCMSLLTVIVFSKYLQGLTFRVV